MEYKHDLKTLSPLLLIILIGAIVLSWYIPGKDISTFKTSSKTYLTLEEAIKYAGHSLAVDRKYFIEMNYVIQRNRTAIPFYYNKQELSKTEGLFSKKLKD